MICADTSVWVAFLNGDDHEQVNKFAHALRSNILGMAPAVLSELISFPGIDLSDIKLMTELPFIDLKEGYWHRVGESRREILKQGLKARLADAHIAQSCMDSEIPLLAIDQDFRHFTQFGLVLV